MTVLPNSPSQGEELMRRIERDLIGRLSEVREGISVDDLVESVSRELRCAPDEVVAALARLDIRDDDAGLLVLQS